MPSDPSKLKAFQYEEEQYHEIEYYLHRGFEFLLIQLLLELYTSGKSSISMNIPIKMSSADVEEYLEEVTDSNEHWSIESMVLGTLVFLIEDVRLGKATELAINGYPRAVERIAENAVNTGFKLERDGTDVKSNLKSLGMQYSSMIDALIKLKPQFDKQEKEWFENAHKNNRPDFKEGRRLIERMTVNAKDTGSDSPFIELMTELPDLTELSFEFDVRGISEAQEKVQRYLNNFAKITPDGNIVKQIEKFCIYLKTLNVVGNIVSVPFSIQTEGGFEAIKILSHLKQKGAISFDWLSEDGWNISFAELPITPQTLIGTKEPKESTASKSKTKYNLSFADNPTSLTFSISEAPDIKVPIQGQIQKEVLRVIFRNMTQAFESWSLYDISETLGGKEDVDEVAVRNALYQFSKKVRLYMPEIERFFIFDQNSARIDTRYVNKN
jgi:hypothetical protein